MTSFYSSLTTHSNNIKSHWARKEVSLFCHDYSLEWARLCTGRKKTPPAFTMTPPRGRSSRTSGSSLAVAPSTHDGPRRCYAVSTSGDSRGDARRSARPPSAVPEPVRTRPVVTTSQGALSGPPAPPSRSRRPRTTLLSLSRRPSERGGPSRRPKERAAVDSRSGKLTDLVSFPSIANILIQLGVQRS